MVPSSILWGVRTSTRTSAAGAVAEHQAQRQGRSGGLSPVPVSEGIIGAASGRLKEERQRPPAALGATPRHAPEPPPTDSEPLRRLAVSHRMERHRPVDEPSLASNRTGCHLLAHRSRSQLLGVGGHAHAGGGGHHHQDQVRPTPGGCRGPARQSWVVRIAVQVTGAPPRRSPTWPSRRAAPRCSRSAATPRLRCSSWPEPPAAHRQRSASQVVECEPDTSLGNGSFWRQWARVQLGTAPARCV